MTIRKLIERGADIDAPIVFQGIARHSGGVILHDHVVDICDIYVDYDNVVNITAYYRKRDSDEQSNDSDN